MGDTVGANMRSALHKSSEGVTLAFPSVCKTPAGAITDAATPIPYPAVATKARKVQAEKKIKNTKLPPAAKSPMTSSGTEPGTRKGIGSHRQMGKAQFMKAASIKFEGEGVSHMTSMPGARGGQAASQAERAREQAKAAAEAASLRSQLSALAQRIQSMDSPDPNEWQKALEEYLVAAGALYVTLHG